MESWGDGEATSGSCGDEGEDGRCPGAGAEGSMGTVLGEKKLHRKVSEEKYH